MCTAGGTGDAARDVTHSPSPAPYFFETVSSLNSFFDTKKTK